MVKRRVVETESELDSSCSEYSPAPIEKVSSRKRQKRKVSGNAHATHTEPRGDDMRQYLPSHSPSIHQIQSSGPICRSLLQWYAGVATARGMPWRKPYDPSLDKDARSQRAYEVWVSEIMLQQTQVVTVIPYYNRWMEKFPTIYDLAAASIDEVNSLWKGLGYYSRASRLLSGAQKVVKDFNGFLPDKAKDMEASIPGIGRYSAGAICSIAYGEAVPVLDGNVHRLLSRLLALHAQPKAKATLDVLWSAATAIVRGVRPPKESKNIIAEDENTSGARSPEDHTIGYPGDVNQALIELGSTICKVRDPNCEVCPLRGYCTAYRWSKNASKPSYDTPDIEEVCNICEPLEHGGGVLAFPMKAERKKAREELDLVNVIEWRSRKSRQRFFLLAKRPENGLLAGLHEFPTSVNVSTSISTASATSIETVKSLLSTYLDSEIHPHAHADPNSYHIVDIKPAGDVLHVFSHIRKTYRVQWVLLEGCDHPPMIAPSLTFNDAKSAKALNKRRKQTSQSGSSQRDGICDAGAAWFEMNEVTKANIGTGVRKVWELAKKLWD